MSRRYFLTPNERLLLNALPPDEAAFLREFMDTFDARLVEPVPLGMRRS